MPPAQVHVHRLALDIDVPLALTPSVRLAHLASKSTPFPIRTRRAGKRRRSQPLRRAPPHQRRDRHRRLSSRPPSQLPTGSSRPSRPIASGFDDRRCTDNVPPSHDKRRPVTDVRRQKLQVDRVGPRGQMFDELEVGHEVNITAGIRVPSRHQVGCRCWPPAHYLCSAGHVQGAVPVLVQEKQLGAELSPADLDGASPISSTNVVLPAPVLSICAAQDFGRNREAHPYRREVRPGSPLSVMTSRVGSPGRWTVAVQKRCRSSRVT